MTCELCGKPLRRDNKTGICWSSSCKREAGHRRAVAETDRRRASAPACELCGKPLHVDNRVGICTREGACQREHHRRSRHPGCEVSPERYCELCGVLLRSDNTLGVCNRNPVCAGEALRMRNARRDPEGQRAAARRYSRDPANSSKIFARVQRQVLRNIEKRIAEAA